MPAKTPDTAIERLNSALRTAMRPPAIRERLAAIGIETVDTTPAQFDALIAGEITKREKVVKPLKISPE